MTEKLLTVTDIAHLTGRSAKGVHTLMWEIRKGLADPNTLPAPLAIPGRPKWTAKGYNAWITRNSQDQHAKAAPQPAGRPCKTEPPQISLY